MTHNNLTGRVRAEHTPTTKGDGHQCAVCGQQYPCDARKLTDILNDMDSRIEYGAIGEYAELGGISLREASSCERLGLKPAQRLVLTGAWEEVGAS